MFAGATLPAGHLWCYGQAVSRTTYADLFAAIGTIYGAGDGSTTFNVPDLRGRVVAGQDDMGGTSANRLTGLSGGVDGDVLGGAGGEEAHQLSTAELAAHTHTQDSHNHTQDAHGHPISGGATDDTSAPFTGPDASTSTATAFGGGIGTTVATNQAATAVNQNTGGDTAHNNVQPTIILNFIIVAAI